MTYRIRNILIAIGLAVVAMLLVLLYVTNYKRSVQHAQTTEPVYVAAHDIAPGATGADIAKHDLRRVSVAHDAVVPGAISNPDQIRTLVLSSPIYAGEQVTVRPFADVAAQGIRAHLRGTMRAMEIVGDPNQVLQGTLHEGDHVDLLANLRVDPNSNTYADKIVVRDIPVLAVSDPGATSKVGGNSQPSVTLEVSDAQATKVMFSVHNGDWSLELRPVVNAADSKSRVDTIASVLGGN